MRPALALIGLAATAAVAAPAEARMSQVAMFGAEFLSSGAGGGFLPFSLQSTGDPAGATFERMFRDFSSSAERLPRPKARNDMEATLQAMEEGHVGFGGAKSPANARRGRPARKPRIKS